jgi:hypothetical protein
MAVKPAAGGLPVNTPGSHTQPAPTPAPTPSAPTTSAPRQLSRRRSGGRGQKGGAGK